MQPDMQNCKKLTQSEFENVLLKAEREYKVYMETRKDSKEVKIKLYNIPPNFYTENISNKRLISIYSYDQEERIYFGDLENDIVLQIEKDLFHISEDKDLGWDYLSIAIYYTGLEPYTCPLCQDSCHP